MTFRHLFTCWLLALISIGIHTRHLVAQSMIQEVEETPLLLVQDSKIPELGPVQIEFIDAPGIAVAEDMHGFMWFGAHSGLYRYDGQEYVQYQHDPYDSTSLSENWVESIFVGSDGMIWIGTFGRGLNRLNPETDRFTHFTHEAGKPTSLSQDTVTVILEDSWGDLWVGTHGGLNRFDKTTETFTRYLHDPDDPSSLSNNQVRALYEDSEGTIWVGTGSPAPSETPVGEGGLNRFNRESQSFTRYLHDPADSTSLINNKVMSIYEDSRGTFWVGTSGDGLHSMNRRTGSFTRHHFDPDDTDKISVPVVSGLVENTEDCIGFACGGVTFIKEDRQGMLWIGGFYGGVNRYDLETGAMSHHEQGNSGLVSNTVWSMHESRDGTLWVGAWDGMHKVFASVNSFPLLSLGAGDVVQSFQEDSNQMLWISYFGEGLITIDRSSGNISQYQSQEGDPTSLISSYIYDTTIDSAGNLWMTHYYGGISRYNLSENNFKQFFTNQEGVSQFNSSISILADRNGQLWVGTYGPGLYHLDPQTETLINHYTNNPNDTNSLNGGLIFVIQEVRDGDIWVGTTNGLNVINRGLSNQSDQANIRQYLPGRDITSLLEDKEGYIWVGTWGDGLYRLNPETGQVLQYTSMDGLPGNKVAGIIEGNEGFIWVSTSEGQYGSPINGKLTRFNPTSVSFTNFTHQDGLPDIGFVNAAIKTHDGLLFFGGVGGFTFFDPSVIQDPSYRAPKIALTGLQISNEQITPAPEGVLTRPVYLEDSIELSYGQNDFTFDYTAFAFSTPDQIQYQYQLEPYDSEWVSARSQQSARYSRMPPGEYRFRVRTIDSRGIISAEEATMRVSILPPWWRTWWANGVYALIFAAGVFAVNRIQRKRLIQKERERAIAKELEQAKEIEKAYKKLGESHDQLKSAQDQIVQQEKLASLGQLTAGIAHEIKNPLNFVNNFSDLSDEMIQELIEAMKSGDLNEAEELAKDISQNLKKIREHGTRADGIVKSMLQHSRGGDGKMEPTLLNPLIKEYVNLAFHGMRAGKDPINVDIKLDLDENVSEVEIIAKDFSRVILNLCNNALDAMREKANVKRETADEYEPKLTVRTHKEDQAVTIEIQDNGPGIPEEIKDKILQPFFTTKKGTAGTGLGLSITNDIIKAHGGQLEIKTEEGNGSVFVFSLPAV